MIGPEIRPPCSNLPTKLYGSFSFPGGNPLNFGDYEVVVNEFVVNKKPTYVPRGSNKGSELLLLLTGQLIFGQLLLQFILVIVVISDKKKLNS